MTTELSSTSAPDASFVVGVLALQGAFERHSAAVRRLGYQSRLVRTPEHLSQVDALIIPGGESTTMAKLAVSQGLREPLAARLDNQMPAFGTCAGLIMLGAEISDGRADQYSFGVLDVAVRRNGYGRQIDSFEADIPVVGLAEPFRAVFIRAPIIERVADTVEILAEEGGNPVLVRQGNCVGATFHPELVDDERLHAMFIEAALQAA